MVHMDVMIEYTCIELRKTQPTLIQSEAHIRENMIDRQMKSIISDGF